MVERSLQKGISVHHWLCSLYLLFAVYLSSSVMRKLVSGWSWCFHLLASGAEAVSFPPLACNCKIFPWVTHFQVGSECAGLSAACNTIDKIFSDKTNWQVCVWHGIWLSDVRGMRRAYHHEAYNSVCVCVCIYRTNNLYSNHHKAIILWMHFCY